jgi:hypothetical protein
MHEAMTRTKKRLETERLLEFDCLLRNLKPSEITLERVDSRVIVQGSRLVFDHSLVAPKISSSVV